MKKIISLILALVAVVAVAGCGGGKSGSSVANTRARNIQDKGQDLTAQAFANQQASEPYPASLLHDSTERANLIRHLLRFNDPNKVGYVYIMNFGKIVGYYVVKGKVSSNNSQLTTSDFVQRYCSGCSGGGVAVTVPAPGDDGSYGANEDGVFFFTTNNVMVVTNLDYLYSDQPLSIDVPILGGDPNATETPQQLAEALRNECKAVGKAAGVNSIAQQECSQTEIQKIAPTKGH